MNVNFKPSITRTAQLKPGDLFIVELGDEMSTGLLITDPMENDDRSILILSAQIEPGVKAPILEQIFDTTVISFGNNYALRLPCQEKAWVTGQPPEKESCILVTENSCFLRAFFKMGRGFRSCYVDLQTGEISSGSSSVGYTTPPGIKAFAREWDLLTAEAEPRIIFSKKQDTELSHRTNEARTAGLAS